ncbi:hypothetical protein RN001_000741 [Aquatica leii]|uniref:Uncharacterized protein n=1 Tax=Aquatica leii TaxID=1421715 RepID=A0AAN7PAG7_9COLE|nr:hypothetical protein RN001_000741 [Aquatica leii]
MSNSKSIEIALKKLNVKRGGLKTQITLLSKYLETLHLVNTATITNLQKRVNKFEPLLDSFEIVQCEIELLDEDIDKNLKEREDFQNSYYDLIAQATEILEKHAISAGINGNSNVQLVPTKFSKGFVQNMMDSRSHLK